MTRNTDNVELTRTRPDKTTPSSQPIKYAERLKSTHKQAFKSSTHLCITIRWGVPAVGRRGRVQVHVGDSC